MKLRKLAAATAAIVAMGTAQAALFDRGGGMIYDDDFNITWLQDANFAKTSGYDADGKMNWGNATAWASGLIYGGYSDWRLPSGLNQDGSICLYWYCSGSEMGHLFYTEGTLNGNSSVLTSPILAEYFTNMQAATYWSKESYIPGAAAYAFMMHQGYQTGDPTWAEWNAWAVRDGDVAAPVPEPETYAMMLAGLGLLGVMARRRKQAQH